MYFKYYLIYKTKNNIAYFIKNLITWEFSQNLSSIIDICADRLVFCVIEVKLFGKIRDEKLFESANISEENIENDANSVFSSCINIVFVYGRLNKFKVEDNTFFVLYMIKCNKYLLESFTFLNSTALNFVYNFFLKFDYFYYKSDDFDDLNNSFF